LIGKAANFDLLQKITPISTKLTPGVATTRGLENIRIFLSHQIVANQFLLTKAM